MKTDETLCGTGWAEKGKTFDSLHALYEYIMLFLEDGPDNIDQRLDPKFERPILWSSKVQKLCACDMVQLFSWNFKAFETNLIKHFIYLC